MKTLSRKCSQDKNLIESCKSQAVYKLNYIEWLSSTLIYIADIIQFYYSILMRHFEFSRWIILKTKLYDDKIKWEILWKHWEILWVKLQAVLIDIYIE